MSFFILERESEPKNVTFLVKSQPFSISPQVETDVLEEEFSESPTLLFLVVNDCLQCSIAPSMELSISDPALLLLISVCRSKDPFDPKLNEDESEEEEEEEEEETEHFG